MQAGGRNVRDNKKKSFIEVLEAELRTQIRAELMKELAAANPGGAVHGSGAALDLGVFVDLNTPRTGTKKPHSKSAAHAYRNPRQPNRQRQKIVTQNTPAQDIEKRVEMRRNAHSLDAEDIAALEFLRRNGANLSDDFHEGELKSAYRFLALRLHPDRHVGASERERLEWTQDFALLNDAIKRLARHNVTTKTSTAFRDS